MVPFRVWQTDAFPSISAFWWTGTQNRQTTASIVQYKNNAADSTVLKQKENYASELRITDLMNPQFGGTTYG